MCDRYKHTCPAVLCAGMDVDEDAAKPADAAAGDAAAGDKAAGEGKEGEGEGKEKAKEKEPSSYTLTAPCRVVPQQVKHVSFPTGATCCCAWGTGPCCDEKGLAPRHCYAATGQSSTL